MELHFMSGHVFLLQFFLTHFHACMSVFSLNFLRRCWNPLGLVTYTPLAFLRLAFLMLPFIGGFTVSSWLMSILCTVLSPRSGQEDVFDSIQSDNEIRMIYTSALPTATLGKWPDIHFRTMSYSYHYGCLPICQTDPKTGEDRRHHKIIINEHDRMHTEDRFWPT